MSKYETVVDTNTQKWVKLSEIEKKIVKYLLNLKGERLIIEKMSKDIGTAKATIYEKLDKLQKSSILRSSWQINPFALGFKIVQAEAVIEGLKEKDALKKLLAHKMVISIKKCFDNRLLISIIVKEIEDYSEIEKYFKTFGVKFLGLKIITDSVYES
jgi:DNA-binding Lrp family transcriptional regulator